MSIYKRMYAKNGIYFFTVVTNKRSPILLKEEVFIELKNAWQSVKKRYPFKTLSYCILPDHLHCIWKLSNDDQDYSKRWNIIKSLCSRNLRKYNLNNLWQNRFWEHCIKDDSDLEKYFDYIHYNPVKHAYVDFAREWKFSSFSYYQKRGIYLKDWGKKESLIIKNLKAGE